MFYIVLLALFIAITIPLALLTILLGFFDRYGKRVYRINQFWTWLILRLGRFQLRWIAKKELLRVPLFGWAMWATKHITVDRADPADAVRSLDRAREK